MNVLLSFANWLLPLIYLALVIDYGATFILRVRTHARNPSIVLAIAFHAVFLILRGAHLGGLPLVSTHELLSVIALSSAIVYGVMEVATRDRRAGIFVFLLIFHLQYTSSVFSAGAITGPTALGISASSGWERLHVIPGVFAYTALTFAAVYAMLYLVGQRNLKLHRFGLLFDRLPPLELLGKLSWYALLGGCILMTITLVTGSMVFRDARYAAQHQVIEPKIAAKIITGLVAWSLCAVAILGRWIGKWPVSRVSRTAVAGFVIILTLFVASAVLS